MRDTSCNLPRATAKFTSTDSAELSCKLLRAETGCFQTKRIREPPLYRTRARACRISIAEWPGILRPAGRLVCPEDCRTRRAPASDAACMARARAEIRVCASLHRRGRPEPATRPALQFPPRTPAHVLPPEKTRSHGMKSQRARPAPRQVRARSPQPRGLAQELERHVKRLRANEAHAGNVRAEIVHELLKPLPDGCVDIKRDEQTHGTDPRCSMARR